MENKKLFENEEHRTEQDYLIDMVKKWDNTARRHLDPQDQKINLLDLQPKAKAKFYLFFMMALQLGNPNPENSIGLNIWFEFGLCVCKDKHEISQLGELYISLFLGNNYYWNPRPSNSLRCTFEEFWTAHRDSKLVSLMDRKGLGDRLRHLNIPHLEAFLNGGHEKHISVWGLNQYLSCEDKGEMIPPYPVLIDYGFVNCNGWVEKHELKEVYRRLWLEVDPIDLHKACIEGQLFEFASRHIEVEPKFKRLMWNIYPLK